MAYPDDPLDLTLSVFRAYVDNIRQAHVHVHIKDNEHTYGAECDEISSRELVMSMWFPTIFPGN